MTTEYARNILKMVVAQICQTVGWNAINSTPLEFMVDLTQEYILQVSKLASQYAQVLGRCEANLDDLGLAFHHLNIDLNELSEYVRNIDPVPCAISVPKLPVHRESHLNFLKPGSREVVTRPVYVYEHLPPMYPDKEEEPQPEFTDVDIEKNSNVSEITTTSEDDSFELNSAGMTNGTSTENSPVKNQNQLVFKRPGDPALDGPPIKRIKTNQEEGRPLREIHSVMMTTSGFLSTAREGKLPESRTPHEEQPESPEEEVKVEEPCDEEPVPIPVEEVKVEKKVKKVTKKSDNSEEGKPDTKESKKKKVPKDILFQPDEISDNNKVKKLTNVKETSKLKVLKPNASKSVSPGGSSTANLITGKGSDDGSKQLVMDKDESDSLSNPTLYKSMKESKEDLVDKLPVEPDKQKLNIFKKISSKPKEELQYPTKPSKDQMPHDNPLNGEFCGSAKQEDFKTSISINNDLPHNPDAVDLTGPDTFNCARGTSLLSNPNTSIASEFTDSNEISALNTQPTKRKKKEKPERKKRGPKVKTPKNILNKKKKVKITSVFDRQADAPDHKGFEEFEQHPHLQQNQSNAMAAVAAMNMPPPLQYPYFSPGLIPRPMFPWAMGPKGMMGAPNPTAIPGALRQRFFSPQQEQFSVGKPNPDLPYISPKILGQDENVDTKVSFNQLGSPPVINPVQNSTANMTSPINSLEVISPVVPFPLLPPEPQVIPKLNKPDKIEKKTKEHKKEKKDKLKKKKEKKDKHKDKGDKEKVKKDKSDKKDKLEKIKEKKEKKERKKVKEALKKLKEEKPLESVPKLTLKLGPAGGSPRPPTPDSALTKKITIKPPKRPDEDIKREPAPELARISALVTRPPKQKSKSKANAGLYVEEAKEDKENGGSGLTTKSAYTVDDSGQTIWICPACGKQDDGSPMIGCDDCDAWYHWVCVGIQVAPAANENWYCRLCLTKNQELYNDKKKKKRKKKLKLNA